MKKRVLALMLVLGMTFSLAACGSSNDKKSDDTKTETTDKDSKEKMTTVKWNYGSSGNVLVTIAEEEGYFEDEGIEIEPVEATQNMDAMALLAAGKVDVVSNAGTSNPLQQIAQGVDLTIFGGHMVEGCMPVVAKAGTEWKGIESFIGQSVAVKNFNLFFDKNSILLFCTKHMYCYCIICFFFFIKYIFHSSLYPFSCTTIKLALFPAVLLSLSSS